MLNPYAVVPISPRPIGRMRPTRSGGPMQNSRWRLAARLLGLVGLSMLLVTLAAAGAQAAPTPVPTAANETGIARAWGGNYEGQLGDGTSSYVNLVPGSVFGIGQVTQLKAGGRHSLAL